MRSAPSAIIRPRARARAPAGQRRVNGAYSRGGHHETVYRERGREGAPRGRTRSPKCEDTARDCRSRLARLPPRTPARIGAGRSAESEARRPRILKPGACGSNVGGTRRKIAKTKGRNNPAERPMCFRRFSADCFHLLAALHLRPFVTVCLRRNK